MSTRRRSGWTDASPAARAVALPLARGRYQTGVLTGWHNLSGSSLRGRARSWSATYAVRRAALLDRVRAAGVTVTERTAEHGARILVLRLAEEQQRDVRGVPPAEGVAVSGVKRRASIPSHLRDLDGCVSKADLWEAALALASLCSDGEGCDDEDAAVVRLVEEIEAQRRARGAPLLPRRAWGNV